MDSSSDEDSDSDVFGFLPSTIEALKSSNDPSELIANLTALCDALAFTQYEDDLAQFPLKEVAPVLVELAGKGVSPDAMLLVVRVFTYLLDLVPRAAKVLVKKGAIAVLCGPLMEIEYLDVAEQSLVALEKLSRRQTVPCLKAGVIQTVLRFIDFFDIRVQRVAISIAMNACRKVPEDCLSTVTDAVPTLCNLLDYQDQKLVESAATCLMKIVENFSHSSDLLDELCKHGVVKHSVKLISPCSTVTLSEKTNIGMIELLVRLANSSLLAVSILYELNINSILGNLLRRPHLSHSAHNSHSEDDSRDQIFAALKLLNQLIPPMACDEKDIQLVSGKNEIIVNEPKLSLQFAEDILPALIQAVNSGASTRICYGSVSVILNYFLAVTPDVLRVLIKNANIPKFLASLLSQKDHHLLIPSLRIVEVIMGKLPGELLKPFVKEGVSHAISVISKQDNWSQTDTGDTDDQTIANSPRCLCYAFDPCSSPSSSESRTCRQRRCDLSPLAQRLMSTFFTETLISSMVFSENLRKLKACCMEIDNNVHSALPNSTEKEEYLTQMLGELVKVLNEGESVSTFEFIESGIPRFLVHYLTNGDHFPRGACSDKTEAYHTVLKRFQTFTSMLLSGQSWQLFPLTSLVRHLQNALSSLECFPVILSSGYRPTPRRADISAEKPTMHPCLQVNFVTEERETELCNYNNVLTVNFSSSWDTIEEFLWPKVKKKTSVTKSAQETQRPGEKSAQIVDSQEQGENSMLQNNEDDNKPKLVFLLDGKQLDRSVTLYQAILQDKINQDPAIIISREFWNEVHIVKLGKTKALQLRLPLEKRSFQVFADTSQSSLSCDTAGLSWQNLSFFSSMLPSELPCKLERSNPAYDILYILKFLEGINGFSFQLSSNEKSNAFAEGRLNNFDDLKLIAPSLPQTEFISSKLNSKLEQQMHDHLVLSTATMPLWCTQIMVSFPFLFSLEARWKYFFLNTLGISRNHTQNSEKNEISNINDRRSLSASLRRKKFKVHRDNILGSAVKMMNWYASKKVLLEIVFSNEVGTGLGPTLEFYTLVSHELQKVGMGMWRGDQTSSSTKLHSRKSMVVSDSSFVRAHSGLFPRPWSNCTESLNGVSFSKVLKNFFLLGQLVARAIRDGRILDFPFSRAFYKLVLEKDLDIYDIQSFDPELGRTLIEFQALVKRKAFLESGEHSEDRSALSFRNARIEDLCLDFALPGYPDYVFASSDSKMVNMSNLGEYISLVVDATVGSGISRQLEYFKSGFNEVFPIKALQIFTAEELEQIVSGEQDTWDINEFQDHIKFDHGYSSTSPPAIMFLEIIQEFEVRQRRAFLLFVTGAPRLPPGGLAALRPKLTIVCKHRDNDADMELPSVMTCANYLKLPPYSSKERMKEKLLYAIMEGQGAFHLS